MVIEKAFGLLKRRFPALRNGLRFKKIEDTCVMTTCACVLHNILLDRGDNFPGIDIYDNTEDLLVNNDSNNEDAIEIRRNLINEFFQ